MSSQYREWLGIPVSILITAIVLLGLPAVFLHRYQQEFGYESAIIYFGLAILMFLMGACYGVVILLAKTFPPRQSRFCSRLFTLCFTFITFLTAVIYGAAYLSNRSWGATITYEMVGTFAGQGGALIDLLPFSRAVSVAMLCAAILALLLFVVCGYLLYSNLSDALVGKVASWMWQKKTAGGATAKGRTSMWVGISLLMLIPAASIITQVKHRPLAVRGEPISSFFEWFSTAHALQRASHKAAIEDHFVRTTYPKSVAFERRNVILIFLDSLRADRMSLYGYERATTPFLSQLHRDGLLHRVDMALSTCSDSFCGIGSTMSSRPFHQISADNFKLHELLADLGYRNNFYLTGDHKSWYSLREFYGKVDNWQDHLNNKEYTIHDDFLLISALEKISDYSGNPNFFFFFLMSSHVVGKKYAKYERYTPAVFDDPSALWSKMQGTQRVNESLADEQVGRKERGILSNRYDNGVLQADAFISKIFSILNEKGYLKNSVVVILGDHGDGLGEHGNFGHGWSLYQEDIRIPLLIYDDDVSVYKNASFATQLDVAPTIIDRLGLPIPGSWQGISLLRPATTKLSMHQTRRGRNTCRAVVSRTDSTLVKYIRCGKQRGSFTEELYDLQVDPHERQNVLDRGDPKFLARMRREMDALWSASGMPVPDIVPLVATATGDGIVNIPGVGATGFFGTATVNFGGSGSITVSADTGDANLPIEISLCQTNPLTAVCIKPSQPTTTVTTTFNTDDTPTFSFFVTAKRDVPFDPTRNRIFVRFKDERGVTRGTTSVAVRTQ